MASTSIRSTDDNAAPALVADNVFEEDAQSMAGESIAGVFGPFDDHDCVAVDDFMPTQIREV
jgi:hypothetical protein